MSDDERDYDQEESVPPLLPDEQESADDGKGSLWYRYKNYGEVAEDKDFVERMPTALSAARGSGESSIRVQKFPVKLYVILAQKEFRDIITWMPHGRSWKVLKPSMFESLVMPMFFEYSNYHSFNRLVNAWSFRRVSSGPDRGSYYHELFLRGKPHLQKYMRRLPKTHKKLPMRKGDEPDFYKMDKVKPLPQIEDAPIPLLTGAPNEAAHAPMREQLKPQLLGPGPERVVTPPRSALAGIGLGMSSNFHADHSGASTPSVGGHVMHPHLRGPPVVSSRYALTQNGMYHSSSGPDIMGNSYDEYDMPARHMPLSKGGSMPPQISSRYGALSPQYPHSAAAPGANVHRLNHPGMNHPHPPPATSPAHMRPPPARPVPVRTHPGSHMQSLSPTPHHPRVYPQRHHYTEHHSPAVSSEQYYRYQQQQMSHMQSMHQMRISDHQQARYASQDEYAMRAMASPARY